MTFTPGLIVRIDWDDAGDYSHADSDVTADHAAHEVQWGADAESDRGGLFSAYAEGTLVLRNLGGRYTLGTSSAQPGIGGRHRCQLQATYGLYGGAVLRLILWDGYALSPTPRGQGRTEVAVFPLEGRQAARRRAQYPYSSNGETLETVILNAAVTPPDLVGTTAIADVTLGAVLHSAGTMQDFLESVAMMAGGYQLEGNHGELIVMSHAEARAMATSATIRNSTGRIRADGFRTGAAVGFVRNKASFVKADTAAAFDFVSEEITVELAGGNDNRSPTYRWADFDATNPLDVGEITLSQIAPNNTILRYFNVNWLDDFWAYVHLNNTNQPGSCRLVASAEVFPRGNGAQDDFEVTASIDEFGTRELAFPEWFSGTAEGYAVARDWLTTLSQPTEVTVVPFLRGGVDRDQAYGVDAIGVGDVVALDIDDPVRGERVLHHALCVGVELVGDLYELPERICTFVRVAAGVDTRSRWGRALWGRGRWS